MNTLAVPDDLKSICNSAVHHAHGNGPLPKGLPKLQAWLEGDGWDDLVAAWIDERMAVKLKEKSSGIFSDDELRAFEGLDDSEEISNEARVSYARGRVNDWLEDDDGFHVPSVHCIQICDVDGDSAVLGYLVEIHGQGGPHPMYCGLFANRDSFYSHLREIGLVLSDEVDAISDEVILKLWEKPS